MLDRDQSRPTGEWLAARDYQSVEAWLVGIRDRRAEAPSKTEIQAAVTAALEAGMNISDVARATGIPRQQFYQGKYDLSANNRSHRPPAGSHAAGVEGE